MDHVIDKIRTYYEIELDYLAEELASKKYSKLSECPSYPACKAMLESMHVLERYYYGESKTISIRDEMRWRGLL
jgi:hypothetical protein